jgi:hypothetical protein
MKRTIESLAIALLAAANAGAAPVMKNEAGVAWICGGIGAEEREALAHLGKRANLEVLFVTAKRGAYLAGAELSLFADRGAGPLLNVKAEGPTCLVELPAGAYRLEARYEGASRSAKATIAANGRRARVVFTFPDEPWDGIRATEEEKRQARQP